MNRYLHLCIIPALFFYLLALAVLNGAGFSTLEILRDPPQLTGQSSFLGFLSNVGVWFWVSGAAVCLSRASTWEGAHTPLRRVLVFLGLFSLVLAIDDLFMIHDRYIAEGIVVPLYALALGVFVNRCREIIRAVDTTSFVLTGVFLALSVAVDAVQEVVPIPYPLTQAVEEGLKFLGGASWLYFCIRAAACRAGKIPSSEG